jgi:cytochrome c peroxidase
MILTTQMEFQMHKFAYILLAAFGAASLPVQADVESAQKLANKYAAFAKNIDPAYKPSADAGRAFFSRKLLVHGKEISCSSCHTDNPAAEGKDVKTGKPIKPLAPSANPKRFNDLEKVETNFEKHCLDVLGKDCKAAEKADYITYLLSIK